MALPLAGGPVIAVIGGGASGTLATIYLLREAAGRRLPLRVALIDRHGRHGLGPAPGSWPDADRVVGWPGWLAPCHGRGRILPR